MMPPRLPTKKDFPTSLKLSVTAPPNTQPPTNVLILLHGLGDTNASFTQLGAQLSLPETACIALQAPAPLPFDIGGFHWGDDIIFDQASGSMDFDTGFEKSCDLISVDLIRKGLIEGCGYQERDILFYGFGQGGMAALAVALKVDGEFSGVVSVGGPVPGSSAAALKTKSKTPVLVLGGSSNSLITTTAAKHIKDAFDYVQVHQWRKPGDGMPSSRDEMLPIMQFFARRLKSRAGVPPDSVEL